MRRFAELFRELDETNRTKVKVAALERYFREAPHEDAAWALFFLSGKRLPSPVKTKLLREWVSRLSGQPLWLVEECYGLVGDLAETLALLLPEPGEGATLPLHRIVEERIVPLQDWDDPFKYQILSETWGELSANERFVYNKLITGAFRVGVHRTLVVRALSAVAGIEPAVMAHRMMGNLQPRAEDFAKLLAEEDTFDDPARPYPFYLAYPLEDDPESLPEPPEAWQVEWKWDGIRAQLIKRRGTVILWSRGEEIVTERFPEIAGAAAHLPDGTVLDGEVLAWKAGKPLPFGSLQKRIGRKNVTAKILEEAPAVFMALDCLEDGGEDVRERSTEARRELLEKICAEQQDGSVIVPSPLVHAETWEAFGEMREQSRKRGVEGFMLKRRGAPYQVGRVKGDWWKWKVDPYTIDAVMIYAQSGHGRRAGLFTDYTFAVWEGEELVPFAKAYSGLNDAEIREVDAFVRSHTLKRFGPVRTVEPELVFELAFEAIQESTRHKSGVAVRFPRIARWRKDKKSQQADTLETLFSLLPKETAPK